MNGNFTNKRADTKLTKMTSMTVRFTSLLYFYAAFRT